MSNTQTTIELNKFIKKFNSDLKKFLPKNTNTLNKSKYLQMARFQKKKLNNV